MERIKVIDPRSPARIPAETTWGEESVQSRFARAMHEPAPQVPLAGNERQPPSGRVVDSTDDLGGLLGRVCSAMYIGEKSVRSQRIVLALDRVLPGAAAEVVRDGIHLTVRLYARTQSAYRTLSARREALLQALGGGDKRVDVIVIHASEPPDANDPCSW